MSKCVYSLFETLQRLELFAKHGMTYYQYDEMKMYSLRQVGIL